MVLGVPIFKHFRVIKPYLFCFIDMKTSENHLQTEKKSERHHVLNDSSALHIYK